jgi:hypothetical protein
VPSPPPTGPLVHVETLHQPLLYTSRQILQAYAIARSIGRGRFVLAEPPERSTRDPE